MPSGYLGGDVLIFTLVLAVVALLISGLGLVGALLYLRALGLPRVQRDGQVSLVLALTGRAPDLDNLLRVLEAQTLVPRRLILAVESAQDPAHARALALVGAYSFPVEVVVAGHADRCAQKSTNLMAALARVDAADEAVVLFDADILPPPWWLSALATPIIDGTADLVTGYRWPLVARQTLGAHLAAAVERGIAVLPKLRRFNIAWGGSLALSPQALIALEPNRILADTLSDDCTLGDQAAALRLRILNRRALLVPTPMAGSLGAVWRFGRRQYQIGHLYRPSLWWLAFGVLSVRLAAWTLLLAHLDRLEARLALGALVAVALSGWLIQVRVASRLGFPDPRGVGLAQGVLAILKPLVDLFHWSLVAAAVATGRIRWGHVTYQVTGPKAVVIRNRTPWV